MIPVLLRGLCDDAALFPPGNAPLPTALADHARYRDSDFAALVGPLIFPISRLAELAAREPGPLTVVCTAPEGPGTVTQALDRAAAIDGLTLAGLEIAVPAQLSAAEFFAATELLATRITSLDVYIEIPRDDRRPAFLERLAGSPYAAKFRTGGMVAEAYPDERELALALRSAVTAGIPFKATAGLHHAIRNTDPITGFEQHGFLNLLLATHLAGAGADTGALEAVLANRAGPAVAAELAALSDTEASAVRTAFRSFGTCSIGDPLTELVDLHLLPAALRPVSESSAS
ncbi:hypothetical protein [Nocardia jinanensis]|uniref:Uncharacterized protein n=1 Tax=Nocardia jinanensis TaxID=382504 RepID=A0A917RVZ2_9NOCA|nr:hypothetical protein [Nocardia jinanensis]GGL39668.1 hypothetical protein GCM10011588_63070 [Nocardia jinanensis]